MKSITIYIIEWKDVKRVSIKFLKRILFLFSEPKYKIGSKINMVGWGGESVITSIHRAWEYSVWMYGTNHSNYFHCEGLIKDYYKKSEKKSLERKIKSELMARYFWFYDYINGKISVGKICDNLSELVVNDLSELIIKDFKRSLKK